LLIAYCLFLMRSPFSVSFLKQKGSSWKGTALTEL